MQKHLKQPDKSNAGLQTESLSGLLLDIREGKSDAFDRFLTLIQRTVFSFGMKVCGEAADASDTMQETLLTAFRSLPQTELDDAAALKVWLYRVAKNACLMMRRKGKYEPKIKLSLQDLLPKSPQDLDSRIGDWSSMPLNKLVKEEAILAVRKAIDKLPARYRLVLVLRDMEQLSAKETAEVLDISEQTVKIRLHRARLFLRKELGKTFFRKSNETRTRTV